jgi:hypothetical protein
MPLQSTYNDDGIQANFIGTTSSAHHTRCTKQKRCTSRVAFNNHVSFHLHVHLNDYSKDESPQKRWVQSEHTGHAPSRLCLQEGTARTRKTPFCIAQEVLRTRRRWVPSFVKQKGQVPGMLSVNGKQELLTLTV